MAWKKNNGPTKYKSSQYHLAIVLLVVLIIVGLIFWFYTSNKAEAPTIDSSQTTNSEKTDDAQVATQPEFDKVALQKVVDDWTLSVGGVSSVYISDTDGKVVASSNPSDVYFAASIYKLFVAYAGYQQVDEGEVDPTEVYVNGYTRAECLDKMIRDSYSPCAEKLWNEIGKAELTAQLKTYGINNTDMEAITTTAEDSGIMLARIARGEGLSEESQAAYLSSIKEQEAKYRRGFPSGFESLTVYNKVGWNELKEWHDSAIVELADGRKLIVTVMSENVGYSNVAKLGAALENSLTTN